VVREPAVFLFDEPLSNLDAKLRVQMRLEIARLHKRLRTTILYVTHDQVEAMTLADRIAVMHAGFLQQCDTPQAIYNRPVNTYVATFIGSPAMNLWPVEAMAGDRGVGLQGHGIRLDLDGAHGSRLVAALAAGQSADLTLGIRPQDLAIVTESEADAVLHVDVVEPLGAETFVFGELVANGQAPRNLRDVSTNLRADSAPIVRIEAGVHVREGDRLPVRLRRDRLHLFDAAGQRLGSFDPD
jgi:ABC-type sugar transport system ATPase subunit